MLQKLLIGLFILSFSSLLTAQEVTIEVKDKALADVFYEMRDQYQVEFTFNSSDLKGCFITKSATYHSIEEAITDLLSEFDLSYQKRGSIFAIVAGKPRPPEEEKPISYHYFSGFIADASMGETLPAAVIKYQNNMLTTDASGFFNFKSQDSLVTIQIQYLGYFTKDTLLSPSQSYQIHLESSDYYLKEVEVRSSAPVFDMIIGQEAGKIKLNQKTSRFLPGNMDNGIYNMLRLQPGIMASGEQTNDYTIWGSWPGQNIVEYDHIRLFSMSSFDDNQSIVHPLMIKEIEVIKGGFNADYGNGVGGVVNILGKNGDYENFHGNANINNQAVSGYLNIPIADQLSFQTAYRQTFYNILGNNSTKQGEKNDKKFYIPETSFRDFNVKFSGETSKKDHFYINVLSSIDNLNYNYFFERGNNGVFKADSDNTKTQSGLSAEFNKFYKKGIRSSTVFSYSNLQNDIEINRSLTGSQGNQEDFDIQSVTTSQISELKINHTQQFMIGRKNNLSVSAEYVGNTNAHKNDINYSTVKEIENKLNRFGFVLKDQISLFGKLYLQAGLRTDFIPERSKAFVQPRINLSYDLSPKLKLTAAYGKYYQYLYKSTIYNDNDVFLEFWEILNTEKQKVTSSNHYTLGLSMNRNIFNLSIEGFYKTIYNIHTYRYNFQDKELLRALNDGRVAGIYVYAKAHLGQHEIWGAYTLSQNLAKASKLGNTDYKAALHNQTHEVKAALILNFSPFYFSTNYVYGSGLEFTRNIETDELIPYHRLDASLMYKLNIKKVYCQFGISVLNILDNYNIKYNNTIRIPGEELVYSQTTPRTFLLNIYIGF